MKNNIMYPKPKYYESKNKEGFIQAAVKFDGIFQKAADVFCEYSKSELCTKIVCGDDGIELLYCASFEKEEYGIECNEDNIKVTASSHKGMSNGLSCLLKLLSPSKGGFNFQCCSIKDKPDVFYRTFMIDTARYVHDISYLYRYIDLCYLNRLSFLQIHFTDDQNFSLSIPEYPKLNGKYTKEVLTELNEYALSRGITIIPELDIPGHTRMLTTNYPEIFGSCGVLSACERTFSAIEKLYSYIHEVFPDSPYIHIGGDEANISEWEKCVDSQAYMKEHGISSIGELYAEYIRRATDIIFSLGCTPIVWEGFSEEYNDRISKDVIVIVWESLYQTADKLVKDGFKIVNASWEPLYIVTRRRYWGKDDILKWDLRTWRNWYEKSLAYPDGIKLRDDEGEVLGGQMCAWGDHFPTYDKCEELCEEEFELVAERMPAFSERTWNALKK